MKTVYIEYYLKQTSYLLVLLYSTDDKCYNLNDNDAMLVELNIK